MKAADRRGGRMLRKTALCLLVLLFAAAVAVAQDGETAAGAGKGAETTPEAKELSGMSIVGNDEAPKSLYIVPWKSSEIGVETSLNAILNEKDVPVDRDVFKRQLEFYRISTAEPKR
jgi:hypothetical protein